MKKKGLRSDVSINLLLKVAIFCCGILAGVFVYIFYDSFLNTQALVKITVVALIIIIMYLFLSTRYRNRQIQIFDEIKRAIQTIQLEGNRKKIRQQVDTVKLEKEAVEVLDSIEELRKYLYNLDRNRLGLINMVNSVAGNMELEKLLEAIMPKLVDSSRSNWGAFYLANNASNKLEIKSTFGFNKNIYNEFDITIGEGFVGAAAYQKEMRIIKDIPEDTVFIAKTFLGKIKPKNLMLVPILDQEELIGVLVLGSLYEYTQEQTELVDLIKFYLGAAVKNGIIYDRMKRLTNELQFQNGLIQDLNTELEGKMYEKTKFLSSLLDSIEGYAIYSVDLEGNVTTWNRGAQNLYNFSREEIIGKQIEGIYHEDLIERGDFERIYNIVLKEGRYTEVGWRYKKDGTSYYADVMVFPLSDSEGKISGLTNVTRDITKRKEAQDELERLQKFSDRLFFGGLYAIAFIEPNGTVIKFNDTIQEVFGHTLQDISFYSLFNEQEEIRAFLTSGTINAKKLFTRKDNGEELLVSGVDITDDSGRICNVYVSVEKVA